MIYIFEYEIIPGKAEEFWDYMEKEGAPFWLKHPEVKSYEVYSKMGGSPIYEGHVELDSFSDFEKIRKDPDWNDCAAKTNEYVFHCTRRFLLKEKEYTR